MAWLQLTKGRKVKMGLTFEAPDDIFIAQTADPEVRATAVEGAMSHEMTPELIDEAMGMSSMPMVTMIVMSKSVITDDVVLCMTTDELRRHIFECKAVLKASGAFGGLVDDTMKDYVKGVRKQALENGS
jgi:hypothetical protein